MTQIKNQIISRQEIEDRTVEGVIDNGIRKTDERKGLECFCSDNPPTNDFEKQIRGYIFHGNRLILKSLPYADVYTSESDVGDLTNYSISMMHEGTSIRVFYFNDEWMITTHRKIDAYKSKWGTKSFGEIFEENIKYKTNKTLKEFLDTLDKNLFYIFLVGTTETTRIVSPAYKGIILLNCMNNNGEIIFYEHLKDWYQETLSFKNIEEIVKFANKLLYPFTKGHGVFLFSQEKSFKIINENYKNLAFLRNNLPSIPFAYLHNIFNEKNKNKFREIYKSFSEIFDFYDAQIIIIVDNLFKKYIRRFVRKESFIVSKHEHNILYHIHGKFLKSGKIITRNEVLEVLKTIPVSNINKIISENKLLIIKQQKIIT